MKSMDCRCLPGDPAIYEKMAVNLCALADQEFDRVRFAGRLKQVLQKVAAE